MTPLIFPGPAPGRIWHLSSVRRLPGLHRADPSTPRDEVIELLTCLRTCRQGKRSRMSASGQHGGGPVVSILRFWSRLERCSSGPQGAERPQRVPGHDVGGASGILLGQQRELGQQCAPEETLGPEAGRLIDLFRAPPSQ